MKWAALFLYCFIFVLVPHLFFEHLSDSTYWTLMGIFQLVGWSILWIILFENKSLWKGNVLIGVFYLLFSIPIIIAAICVVALIFLLVFYYSVIFFSIVLMFFALVLFVGILGEMLDDHQNKNRPSY